MWDWVGHCTAEQLSIFYSNYTMDGQTHWLPFAEIVTDRSFAEELSFEQPASDLIRALTQNGLGLEIFDTLEEEA